MKSKVIKYLPCTFVLAAFIFSLQKVQSTTIAKSSVPTSWSISSAEIDQHLLIIQKVENGVVYYTEYLPNGTLVEGTSKTAPQAYRAYLQYVLDNVKK